MKSLSDKSNNPVCRTASMELPTVDTSHRCTRGKKVIQSRKMIILSFSLIAIIAVTLKANSQLSLKFGPESFTTNVEGRDVTFVGKGTLKVFTPPSQQRVDVEVASQIDLSNLQQVVPGIVQAKGNKNDTCSEVINFHTVDLTSSAEIKVGVHTEKWKCVYLVGDKPTSKTKVEQNGAVTIALALAIRDGGKALGVDTKVKSIEADGLAGFLLRNSIVGPYLTDWLKAKIAEVIDPSKLKQAFPEGLAAYNPKFTKAQFVDLGNNKLGCELTAIFSLSQDQAQKLIDNIKK